MPLMPPTPPERLGHIAFLARQAGSAAAFSPLIDALSRGPYRLSLAAMGPAADVWSGRDAMTGTDFEALEPTLNRGDEPSLLITGTSSEPLDDAKAWAWAKAKGVTSLAFVDSWVNYRARFSDSHGAWLSTLPDLVAVIDDASAQRLIDAGMAPERLRVVGSPAFDAVCARRSPLPDREQGISLLFASQPLAGRNFPAPWDEHRALDMLLEVLEGLDLEVPITLTLRRHPAEAHDVFDARLKASRAGTTRLEVDTREDRLEALSDAHVVLGVVSMILVEAHWLGRPALSIQPGALAPSDLLSLNKVPAVHAPSSLAQALRGLLLEDWHPPLSPAPAIPRWEALINACFEGRTA